MYTDQTAALTPMCEAAQTRMHQLSIPTLSIPITNLSCCEKNEETNENKTDLRRRAILKSFQKEKKILSEMSASRYNFLLGLISNKKTTSLRNYLFLNMHSFDADHLPYFIFNHQTKNRCVFTSIDLPSRTPLFFYKGKWIDKFSYERDTKYEANCHILTVGLNKRFFAIVGSETGKDFGSMLNHGRENCKPKLVTIENSKYVLFYTTKNVPAFSELTWLYTRDPKQSEIIQFPFLDS